MDNMYKKQEGGGELFLAGGELKRPWRGKDGDNGVCLSFLWEHAQF